MKPKHYFITLIACIMFGVSSCVEPYATPESKQEIDMLVVDGFLDASTGAVNVSLSKATKLSDDEAAPVINDAIVELEDSDNNFTSLTSMTNGAYSVDGLTVDPSKQYRIRIKTNGKVYTSDFVSPKTSPPIDNVNWVPSSDGITITVGTHDDSGASKYYLWTFQETYQYRSYYMSMFKWEGPGVALREPDEQIFDCWRTFNSTKILIANSLRLNSDRIENKELQFIPKGDIKTSVKYSILVKQYVLSREAYDYWMNLQKTTEQLGSLFDPQPGQVLGNIHREDGTNESVLGFFGAGQMSEKRIFISYADLPSHLRTSQPNFCTTDSVMVDELEGFDRSVYLLSQITEGPAVIGYTYSNSGCSDCRTKQGTTVKPAFWP